jgi:hypothetical protein
MASLTQLIYSFITAPQKSGFFCSAKHKREIKIDVNETGVFFPRNNFYKIAQQLEKIAKTKKKIY